MISGDSLWRDRLNRRRGEYDPWDWERPDGRDPHGDYQPGDTPPGDDDDTNGNGDDTNGDGNGYQYTEPEQWGFASDWLENMMSSYGKPIDVSGIYAPLRARGLRELGESWKDQKEMFGASGFGGGRWSSSLIQSGMRERERMEENLTLSMARAQIAAEEAGMGRAMGSVNPYMQNANTMFQAPYQANQWMLQSGLMEQDLIGRQMQNQMNPWMAMLMNATAPSGVGPATYQPGGSIWDMLSNMPWGDILGGGGGGGQYSPTSGDVYDYYR